MTKEKKTHLYLEGKCNGENIQLTDDFRSLKDAYTFLASFKDEEEIKGYFKNVCGKEIDDFRVIKQKTKSGKVIEYEYAAYYEEMDSYCTPENLKKVFISKCTDYDFVDKLKFDEYCMAMLDHENILRGAPINDDRKYNDHLIKYSLVFFPRLQELKKSEISPRLKNSMRRDMETFLNRVLYNSFIPFKIEEKVKNEEYNEGVLRILFDKFVKEKDLKNLRSVNKPKMSDADIEKHIKAELYYGTNTLLDELKKIKEELPNTEDLYPKDKKTFGDAKLKNPEYQQTLTVNWYDKDKLCITLNNGIFFLTLSEAFEKFKENIDFKRTLAEFIANCPTYEEQMKIQEEHGHGHR